MEVEIFETQREFNKKFPSKLYICSQCGNLTPNPYHCRSCNNQSNNFLLTEKTYQYKILETGISNTIFVPIEKEKEKMNGN
ncbi:MAG: hypothetical protein Q4E83_03815 [bacterium]|nr:hypothetical protein [bacterium]